MAIHQKFTGDPSQLIKAYSDLAAHNVKLEQQVAKLALQMGEASRSGRAGMGLIGQGARAARTEIMSLVGSWVSVHTVVRAATAQMEEHRAAARDALDANRALAAYQADTFLNSFGDDPTITEQNRQRVRRLAADAKIDEKYAMAAYSSVQSTGIGTDDQRFEALKIATRLSPQRPENIGNLGKAILMGQSIGGFTAEESASLFLSGGGAAFLENPDQQIRFLRQTMAGSTASAATSTVAEKRRAAEQSIELGAALTTMVGEDRGEAARTAAVKLSGDLHKFFAEGYKVTGPHGRTRLIKPKSDPGAPLDRLEALQGDPTLAKQFTDNTSFETLFESPLKRAILDPKSREAEAIRGAVKKVSPNPTPLQPLYEQLESGTPQIELQRAEQASQANLSELQYSQPLKSRREQARKIWLESLAKTRGYRMPVYGFLDEMAETGVKDFSHFAKPDAVFEDAIEGLKRRQELILAPKDSWGLEKGRWNAPRSIDQLKDEERKDYEYLGKQLEILIELMRSQQQSQSDPAMEKQTQVLLRIEEKITSPPGSAGPSPAAARNERGVHREQ
jgi:hypothetical protein